MVMATDGPRRVALFFPGGDIGCLSVHGTINDVAMDRRAAALSRAAFVLEEGFRSRTEGSVESWRPRRGTLACDRDRRHQGRRSRERATGCSSRRRHRRRAGRRRHRGDARGRRSDPRQRHARDHGVAIMSLRENLSFETYDRVDTGRCDRLVANDGRAVPICTACATERGGLRRRERDRAAGGLRNDDRNATSRSRPGQRPPAIPRPRSALVGKRGQADRDCAPATPTAARGDALAPQGRDAAIVGEVIADPHHFVQWRRASAAAASSTADRRAAAADLLRKRGQTRIPVNGSARPPRWRSGNRV